MRSGLPAGGRRRGFGLAAACAAQRRPQAAVAAGGQQRDVDDADLVGPAGDIEPSDWLAIEDDDVEAGVGVVLAIGLGLRRELDAEVSRLSDR